MDYNERTARQKQITACYQKAQVRLRKLHPDEFKALLAEEYAAAGIVIKRNRLTAEQRRDRDIAKARAILESYGIS